MGKIITSLLLIILSSCVLTLSRSDAKTMCEMSSRTKPNRSQEYVACMKRQDVTSQRRLDGGGIGFCAKDCIKAGGALSVIKACEARCPKLRRR